MSSSSSRCSNFSQKSLRNLSEISLAFHLHILRGETKTCFTLCLANEMSTRGASWRYAFANDRKHAKIWIPAMGGSWKFHDNQVFCLYSIISNQMKSYQIISNHIKSIKCTKKHRRPCAKAVSHGCRMLQNAAAPHLAGWNPKPGNRYICRGSTRACVT